MNLSKSFYSLVWRQKSTLIGLMLITCGLGLFARVSYHQFLYLQAQNMSGLSLFNEMILPLAGLTIFFQLLISLLASLQLVPLFHASGQYSLLQQANIKSSQLLKALLMPVLSFALWPLVNFLIIVLTISLFSNVDLIRLSITIIGLLLLNSCLTLLVIFISIRAGKTLLVLLYSILMIGVILLLETSLSWLSSQSESLIKWQGLFLPFLNFRQGLLLYADLLNFVGWLIFSCSLCLFSIKRFQNQTRSVSKLILILAVIILFLSPYLSGQLDFSRDHRSSFSQSFKTQFGKVTEPLKITAVINEQTSRDEILRGFSLLRQQKADTKIRFQARQNLAPEYNQAGEYIQFSLGKNQVSISYPFEHEVKQVFESTISQLLKRKSQWITFIEGHGEASLFGEKTTDLSLFYQSLLAAGWPVASQNLSKIPLISDNTGLIVIAASKHQWLPNEIDLLENYLDQGGNLMLLADPESYVANEIETAIGISRYPGTLVDWNGYQNGTPHPAVVIVNDKTDHPIMNNLNSLLAFPWASGLRLNPLAAESDFEYQTVISTHRSVWNEMEIGAEQLAMDQQLGENQQAFPLAISRFDRRNQQKILVIGDSHFLSDSAINNYSNNQFAMNLISWMTQSTVQDSFVESLSERDSNIEPSRLLKSAMNWFYPIMLPILILVYWLFSQKTRRQLTRDS